MMNNFFKYAHNNKRYHTINYYFQTNFNSKVFKVSLNAGFTCPNRDGTKGIGGCIYCSKLGSGDFAGNIDDDLVTQFYKVKKTIEKKWPNSKYIGYFQANSNTYANVKVLKEKYETILKLDNVIGLAIATRPDAISNEVLDYLEELNKRTFLIVELGLQTIHDKTAKLINRCHTLECFINMVKELRRRKISVVVHIINGLPYETKEMMLETVKYLAELDIQGIKIHMLNVLKETKLAEMYKKKPFHILTKEEYVDIVCDQLEILPPEIVIHRLTGDPKKEDLIAPTWVLKKFTVLNEIDKELRRRQTYQGFKTSILNKVKQLLAINLNKKEIAIDATIGNGHDTLLLTNLISEGFVYGFDIQDIAIENTTKLLTEHHKTNYQLFKLSHERMLEVLPNLIGKVKAIVFNLGYLPNGDKNITTNYKTTIRAIENSLTLLNKDGICLIVVYPGHKEGLKESIEINKFLKKLKSYTINYYYNTDNKEAPYLISIKK